MRGSRDRCARARLHAHARPGAPGDRRARGLRAARRPTAARSGARRTVASSSEWWQIGPDRAAYNRWMAGEKPIAENRKARHDYHLLERVEAGLQLTGSEVKSLREGRASLQQAYADVRDGEAWLVGAHIDTYDQAGVQNHEPERDRKLLLHRREIDSLYAKVRERGLTLVPTRLYFKNG